MDAGHGRIETRRAEVLHDVGWLAETPGWPGLAGVGRVTATRESDGKAATANRYYITLRPPAAAELNASCAATGVSRTASTGCSTSS